MQFCPGIQIVQELDVIAFLESLFNAPAEQTQPHANDDDT